MIVALLVLAVAVGVPSAAARSAACRHADVVFYTSDTARLAGELSKQASSCTDYYLSLTPTGSGAPRGGSVVTTVHDLGPRFHLMPEARLAAWQTYATANGWYAAGLELRRQMRAAGYDAARDGWAILDVGSPTNTQMGVAVFDNAGTARRDLLDFARGLYTGDDGVPSRGLVFGTNPIQVASDLSHYRQGLRSWYADGAFWTELGRYVRFWTQDTYADARTWGVAGSTLAERTAYLDDFFLHVPRLAAGGGDRTQAARSFLAAAYTPFGNASHRWPAPDASVGIGFGSTDVDLTTMLGFVSAQTYALRSAAPARFGFSFVPRGAAAANTLAVANRIAAAIQASESTPVGACGESGEACAGTVQSAAFTEAWKPFANTLEGSHVVVRVAPGAKVTFASVAARGATQVTTSTPRPAPAAFQRRPGSLAHALATTAVFKGSAQVCLGYGPATYRGWAPRLFRLDGRAWTDVTTMRARAFVCGATRSLGTFAVFAART